MRFDIWTWLGFLLAGGFAVASLRAPESVVRERVDAFCRKRRVRLTADQIEYLRAMIIRDHRVYRLVLAMAFGAGSLLRAASSGSPDGVPYGLLFSLPMVCVGAVGLVHAGREFPSVDFPSVDFPSVDFPSVDGMVGLAPGRRVRLSDYLPSSTFLLTLCGAALTAVAIMVASVQNLPGHLGRAEIFRIAAMLTHGGLLLGLAVLAPLWLKRVCQRPERARDQAHLYLLDAWRAETLGAAVGSIAFAAFVGMLGTRYAIGDYAGPALAFGAACLVGIAVFDDRQALRFRERLWPDLRDGEVFLPGGERVEFFA